MPELIGFYEDHAAEREKFEIIAIHDDQIHSFRQLDRKLADVKKKYWGGKPSPFPILLDGEKKTHDLYGVSGWPTSVLIDPEGKVVGEAPLYLLEAKLTPVSPAQRWARHRDLQKNVSWSFEPKETTLERFAAILGRWAGRPIAIDAEAVKAAGLATNAPLPGVVIGGSITLRSIDELLLAPHGLGVAPSGPGQSLQITKRLPTREKPSYLQKLHHAELNRRLDGAGLTSGDEPPKPLTIDNQSLTEALKWIEREYHLSVALEAKAMQLGQINGEAKVSGTIHPGKLRKSLRKLLQPLRLTVEVRHEVVLVVPVTPAKR